MHAWYGVCSVTAEPHDMTCASFRCMQDATADPEASQFTSMGFNMTASSLAAAYGRLQRAAPEKVRIATGLKPVVRRACFHACMPGINTLRFVFQPAPPCFLCMSLAIP